MPVSRRVQTMKPMNVPWFISGVYVTLRQPRARPSFLIRPSAVSEFYDLRRLAVLDQTDDGRHLASMPWERCLEHFVGFRVGRGEGHQVNDVVDDAIDGSGKAADQPFGAVGDGVEHRLHVVTASWR